jgi:hypothetical protein
MNDLMNMDKIAIMRLKSIERAMDSQRRCIERHMRERSKMFKGVNNGQGRHLFR